MSWRAGCYIWRAWSFFWSLCASFEGLRRKILRFSQIRSLDIFLVKIWSLDPNSDRANGLDSDLDARNLDPLHKMQALGVTMCNNFRSSNWGSWYQNRWPHPIILNRWKSFKSVLCKIVWSLYFDLHTISAKTRLRLLGQLITISQIFRISEWIFYLTRYLLTYSLQTSIMEDPSKLPAEARGFVALPEYVENPDGTFTHQVPAHNSL